MASPAPHELLRPPRRMDMRDPEVLIVGAGPTGLVAAITLARHGVRTLVVERRAAGSTLPRATNVTTRTMEILRTWRLEEAVRAGAVDITPRGRIGHTLADPDWTEYEIGYPTPEEAARWSPTGPAWAPQSHLEPVLVQHLAILGSAELQRGAELIALDETGDGLVARVRDHATGDVRTLYPRYVIGADGIRSTVRGLVGIPFRGAEDVGQRDVALFRAPLGALVGPRPHALNGVEHPVTGTFIPFGRGDRWGLGMETVPGRRRFAEMSARELTRTIADAAGVRDLPVELEYVGPVTFGAQTADRYRTGSAFLVGDAAHRMTPRTGSGMNIGIHDAFDLAWKLAWVLRGWAPPALLDTYEQERKPVGDSHTALTVRPNGSERTAAEAMAGDLGPRIPHVWVRDGAGRASTVDLIAEHGLTVLAGDRAVARPSELSGGFAAPVTVRAVDARAAAALGIGRTGKLVVRPDGRPLEPPAPRRGRDDSQAASPEPLASAAPSPSRPAMSSLR